MIDASYRDATCILPLIEFARVSRVCYLEPEGAWRNLPDAKLGRPVRVIGIGAHLVDPIVVEPEQN